MRDASTLQRRRRLMMLKSQTTAVDRAQPAAAQSAPAMNGATTGHGTRDQLFRECQGRTGLHLMIEVPAEAHPRQVSLDQPYVVIGSDDACDVVIRHRGVAPRHAYLQWIDGRIYCCNLAGSEPGTLEGAWIGRKPVTMGPLRISVPEADVLPGASGTRRGAAPLPYGNETNHSQNGKGSDPVFVQSASDPQARTAELAAEIPQIQLKFAGVEQRDNVWPVDRRLTLIGRGPDCRLRLDHPEIPLVLASLIRTPSSCWLIDLSRRDLVCVNDRVAVLESLDIGDAIQLGPFNAEVSVAPFSLKTYPPAQQPEIRTSAVCELATRHRQRLGALNKSLEAVKLFLDAEHLNAIPELKTALQRYVTQSQNHHREMQEALERLSAPGETT